MYEHDPRAEEQTGSHPSGDGSPLSGTSILMRTISEIRKEACQFREVWDDAVRARCLEWCAARIEAALHEIRTQTFSYEEGATIVGKDVRTLERWRERGRLRPAEGLAGVRFTLESLMTAARMDHADVMVIAGEVPKRRSSRGRKPGITVTRTAKDQKAA